MTIDPSLSQAVAEHQAGRLQEAGELYRAILQRHPNHPEANHNMGVLAVQMKQPAAGLPYFTTALDADPACGQYWLSYIDALSQSGQPEEARQILALARQQGLEGEAVEALAARLAGEAPNAEQTLPVEGERVVAPKCKTKSKPVPSTGKSAQQHGKDPDQQEINTLVALFNQGRYAEAVLIAKGLTERFPKHAIGWKALGALYMHAGKSADALLPMQRTAALTPSDADAHNNLGLALYESGRTAEAEASYRQALKLNPADASAHSNLGACLHRDGRLAEAEVSYRKAIEIDPNYAKAWTNLGAILQETGQLAASETSYRHAIQIQPGNVEAHYNLSITLKELGRLGEAEASCRRALSINTEYAEAHHHLGNILFHLERLDEAEASCRQALAIDSSNVAAHHHLGNILFRLDRLDEAEASYRRAIQVQPSYVNAYASLGVLLLRLDRLDEAEAIQRQAIEINEDFHQAYNNLGAILMTMGRLDEAEACFRRVIQIKPDDSEAYTNLLFCLSQIGSVDAKTLFIEHCRFAEQFEVPLRANWPQYENFKDPERCLQIGLVSGDLRSHAVSRLIEPVLTYLAKSSAVTLHVYYNNAIEDGVTSRIRESLKNWNRVIGLSDIELAKKISADRIDILIDLSGHTAKNRLLTFARKPAPVQASWIGYPGTTGLSSMDYYLSDKNFLPLEQFASQFAEKIVHLPSHTSFLPHSDAPLVNPLPALSNGYITFGSFNRRSKISRSVVRVWGQIMRPLRDSHLFMGGMPEGDSCEDLIEWFSQEGIARERLSFHGRNNMDSMHHQVDICLDTFPCNGGSTTIHALWMGVPTITLAGDTAYGRIGASILGNCGLDEFVAYDEVDFVKRALSWAENIAALSDIRTGLRERFSNSAMGRPEQVAMGLENAFRVMWQRWCAGLPAESFEVKETPER